MQQENIVLNVQEKGAARTAANLKKVETRISGIQRAAKAAGAALGVYLGVQGVRALAAAISSSIDFANALSTLEAKARDVTQTGSQMIGTIQGITTNQLSMAEAAGVAAQAVQLFGQAGADSVGQLTQIAGQAATVFGKTIPEALNIMFQGIASGRATTLRQIGLFIDLDKAAIDMADSLGKSVDELTEAELATSRLNSVLEAGAGAFSDLDIDVNVLDRLKTSLSDLGNVFKLLLTGGSTEVGVGALAVRIENLTAALKGLGESGRRLDGIRAALQALTGTVIIGGLAALTSHVVGFSTKISAAISRLRVLPGLIAETQKSLASQFAVADPAFAGRMKERLDLYKKEQAQLRLNVRGIWKYVVQLAALAAVFAVLYLAYKQNLDAQRKLKEAVENVEAAYDTLHKSLDKTRNRFADLELVLGTVNEITELNSKQNEILVHRLQQLTEQYPYLAAEIGLTARKEEELTDTELRLYAAWGDAIEELTTYAERVEYLTKQFPSLTTEIGLAVDAEGNLYDASGDAITGLADLQDAINQFNTSVIVQEVGKAVEALIILAEAQTLAAIGPEPPGAPGARTFKERQEEAVRSGGPFATAELYRVALGEAIGAGIRALGEWISPGGLEATAEAGYRETKSKYDALLSRLLALHERDDVIPPGTTRRDGRGAGAGADSIIEAIVELTEAQQLAIERTEEWNRLMGMSNSAMRDFRISVELADRGMGSIEDAQKAYDNTMRTVIEGMMVLDFELPLTAEQTEYLGTQLEIAGDRVIFFTESLDGLVSEMLAIVAEGPIPPFVAPEQVDYGFGPGVIPTLNGIPMAGPWDEPEEEVGVPWSGTKAGQYGLIAAKGVMTGGEEGAGQAIGAATTLALTPALGPYAALVGSLTGDLIGGLFAPRRPEPVMEAIPVKVMNFQDMATAWLNITKQQAMRTMALGIDNLAGRMRLKENMVGI